MTDSEFETTSPETLTPVVTATWDLPPNPYWESLEARKQRRSLAIAILLFGLTLISTLAVGAQYASSYAAGNRPILRRFSRPTPALLSHPQLLLAGVPFAFTLIGILLAHELGHFFACRYYGISASYPYFLPAPTLIGTLGAFIRIRSPIYNRKALFDVGLAGPGRGISVCDSRAGDRHFLFEGGAVFGGACLDRLRAAARAAPARWPCCGPACRREICCCIRWDARRGSDCSRRR